MCAFLASIRDVIIRRDALDELSNFDLNLKEFLQAILFCLNGNNFIRRTSQLQVRSYKRLSTIYLQLNEKAGPLHTLAASHYSLKDNFHSTVTLNNKGPEPLVIQPILFSSSGERLEIAHAIIEKNSFKVFDLKDWISGHEASFQEGSLRVLYRGKDFVLGAQIKILDSNSSLIFDEQLVELTESFASTRLEGVWWLPGQDSQINVALSNTTDEYLSLTLGVDGIAPKQKESLDLMLKPHETRVVDVREEVVNKASGTLFEAGGVSIEYSGLKGAILEQVMVKDAALGYSSVVPLLDPQSARSSSLHGTGIRLGKILDEDLTPIIVARNTGNSSTVLSGKIVYATVNATAGEIARRDLKLLPGETKLLDLAAVINRSRIGDIESAGLEFNYSSEPGSVIVAALSTSQSRNHVFQVPLIDPASQHSSTGNYPWSITQDSSTVIYIKNVTSRPQQYFAQLNFDSTEQAPEGGIYQPRLKTVAAGQTVLLKKLKGRLLASLLSHNTSALTREVK